MGRITCGLNQTAETSVGGQGAKVLVGARLKTVLGSEPDRGLQVLEGSFDVTLERVCVRQPILDNFPLCRSATCGGAVLTSFSNASRAFTKSCLWK